MRSARVTASVPTSPRNARIVCSRSVAIRSRRGQHVVDWVWACPRASSTMRALSAAASSRIFAASFFASASASRYSDSAFSRRSLASADSAI